MVNHGYFWFWKEDRGNVIYPSISPLLLSMLIQTYRFVCVCFCVYIFTYMFRHYTQKYAYKASVLLGHEAGNTFKCKELWWYFTITNPNSSCWILSLLWPPPLPIHPLFLQLPKCSFLQPSHLRMRGCPWTHSLSLKGFSETLMS